MTLYQSSFLTSPVEFPCGRTALTAQSGVYTRSAFHYENANTTSLTDTNTTPYPPSTPAPTTVSFMDTRNRRKKLPLWVYSDTEAPTEEPVMPYKRIVGGEVVLPGEIPWQVL